MSTPINRQEVPEPHRDWRGANEVDAPPNKSLSKLARLWSPVRAILEKPSATLARYAHRLIDRTTGIPYSADELEAKILAQAGVAPDAAAKPVIGDPQAAGPEARSAHIWFYRVDEPWDGTTLEVEDTLLGRVKTYEFHSSPAGDQIDAFSWQTGLGSRLIADFPYMFEDYDSDSELLLMYPNWGYFGNRFRARKTADNGVNVVQWTDGDSMLTGTQASSAATNVWVNFRGGSDNAADEIGQTAADPATGRTFVCAKIDTASYPGRTLYEWVETTNAPLVSKASGDWPASAREGTLLTNTFDKTVKIYADGGWRTLVASPAGIVTPADIAWTATNNNATAGDIGEYVQATSPGSSLTSSATTSIASVDLSAGDWDIEGVVTFYGGSATIVNRQAGISASSGALAGDEFDGRNTTPTTAEDSYHTITLSRRRVSLAAPSTRYLVVEADFIDGAVTAYGGITARRVR